MRSTAAEKRRIREYFELVGPKDPIVHLEKVAVERVGSVLYDIWDVHCAGARWWAVTNPLNAYPQTDFKSRDVVLTFHIGLTVRVANQHTVPISEAAAELLSGSWRRWEQAVEALSTAAEAEDFQAVGMRLRECLVSFASEVAADQLVPEGEEQPQAANVVAWADLLVNELTRGSSADSLRSYLKKMTKETWTYVSWLTHAKNAVNYDAEIGVAAVSHLLATMTAARLRWSHQGHGRCEQCGSYLVDGGQCRRCGWVDQDYEPPPPVELSEEEMAARLATPCTPSSDISTFITPD